MTPAMDLPGAALACQVMMIHLRRYAPQTSATMLGHASDQLQLAARGFATPEVWESVAAHAKSSKDLAAPEVRCLLAGLLTLFPKTKAAAVAANGPSNFWEGTQLLLDMAVSRWKGVSQRELLASPEIVQIYGEGVTACQ